MKTTNRSRILVVNNLNEVLLVKYRDNAARGTEPPNIREFWVNPGGGLEAGETFEQAAKRELEEETGIIVDIGPQVWMGKCVLATDGELVEHTQHYFYVKLETGRITPRNRTTFEVITAFKWWSLSELQSSNEIFFPMNFVTLITPILEGEIPSTGIEIEDS